MNTHFSYDFDDDYGDDYREIKETTHVKKRLNDSMGLTAIAKFGWLRAREVGNVLWPHNPSRNVAGARIVRRWRDEKLVLERQLPDGFGPAWVLSRRGAEFVKHETPYGDQNDVISGKKIGDHIEQVGGTWRPTWAWRHDLLSNGFLTLAMGFGAQVVSELELRRQFPNQKKIFDGLYRTDGSEFWFSIETERSGKFSKSARALADSVAETQISGVVLGDREIRATVLIYEDPARRHYGSFDRHVPDHFSRVARQLQARVPRGESVTLIGIPLLTRGGGVIDISPVRHLEVNLNYDSVIDRSVLGGEWIGHDLNFELRFRRYLNLDEYSVRIFPNEEEDDIKIEITDDQSRTIAEQFAGTINPQKAKLRAVEALRTNPKYRHWALRNIDKLFNYKP
jgi:hypothetical protein